MLGEAYSLERLFVPELVGPKRELPTRSHVLHGDRFRAIGKRRREGFACDQHRRARMALAQLDDHLERIRDDRHARLLEPRREARRPFVIANRAERSEAPELAKRSLTRPEQVAQKVLDRAGEQQCHRRRSLEDRTHLLGQSVRVPERVARRCEILKFVEEHDDPLPAGRSDPLRELERGGERPVGIARAEPGTKRELRCLPELAGDLGTSGNRRRVECGARRRESVRQRSPEAAAVMHDRLGEAYG